MASPAKPFKFFKGESSGSPDVYSFWEHQTSTWQYVVADPKSSESVIIDPVLDYDPASGSVSTQTADSLIGFIRERGLKIRRILETHAHADHLSASQYLKSSLSTLNSSQIPICIGRRITQVQDHFCSRYQLALSNMKQTFDCFLQDEEIFTLGSVSCKVVHLPGHTPDHIGYVIGRNVFVGDSIFMPDVGSARADFPGGDARELYTTINRLLSLPEDYRLFVGHDYPPGREKDCVSTVKEQKELNKHGKVGITEDEFIAFREARDRILGAPRLLHPSLQVNIRAGRLPPPDEQGRITMKIPVKDVPPKLLSM